MHGKAYAPEYQGALQQMSVNTDYETVLASARQRVQDAATPLESAQAQLAAAEACRRLGELPAAETAWRSSYRAARAADSRGAMAWALWSGGTLARQRGKLNLALRLLEQAVVLGRLGEDRLARGYATAGVAETLRIRGRVEDHATSRRMHEALLAEAHEHDESRHAVWALEGLAQLDRHVGDLDAAGRRFDEAARIAHDGGDHRGRAWALRGQADVTSLRGEHDRALALLAEAEQLCRDMELTSALAYNRKMRGNVFFRANRFAQAAHVYQEALDRFDAIGEPRGAALAQLGLLKSHDGLGRESDRTRHDLLRLRESIAGCGLQRTEQAVDEALARLDVRHVAAR